MEYIRSVRFAGNKADSTAAASTSEELMETGCAVNHDLMVSLFFCLNFAGGRGGSRVE